MRKINVLTAADKQYARHLGVMLTSLLNSSSVDTIFTITILDGGISREDIGRLTRLTEMYRAAITFVAMDRYRFERYPLSNHIRQAAYYRISVSEILDSSVRKVLYLDCDIIINKDLTELWDTDFNGCAVAAVEEPKFDRHVDLLLPGGTLYFNSGVMLVNLDRWREERIGDKAHNFIRKHPDVLLLHDQDALNAVLCGKWLPLHPKWNLQTDMLDLRSLSSYSGKAVAEAVANPAVIHFTTSSKPWHYMNEHRYRGEYLKYLYRTEWKPRSPKLYEGFRTLVKPIIGVTYKLLDVLKALHGRCLISIKGCIATKDKG
ncbi:glycosyltransferase family 8 protein [Geotalea toluenoxydans]|uniref:glycosyltransferase family 8 protein n=1 Tax=Geotalea toluenoxydans TaxID=421624 RepID=UPI0006D10FC4|nr:glycosyltransferase family 8 protein [Geotalea toluenoxydans]